MLKHLWELNISAGELIQSQIASSLLLNHLEVDPSVCCVLTCLKNRTKGENTTSIKHWIRERNLSDHGIYPTADKSACLFGILIHCSYVPLSMCVPVNLDELQCVFWESPLSGFTLICESLIRNVTGNRYENQKSNQWIHLSSWIRMDLIL